MVIIGIESNENNIISKPTGMIKLQWKKQKEYANHIIAIKNYVMSKNQTTVYKC